MNEQGPQKPALPAQLADRYELEERLGSGGSAEVWRGIDRRLARPVAVKVLHRHFLTDAVTRARFEQEARAAAGLTHRSIVTVYDVAADDDGAAIVMEAIEGRTLAARIRTDGPLPAADAARICVEVAHALSHAHENGIVHRDVKPGNVILGADGRARLTDFGIARLLEEGSIGLTTTGTIAGTLRYLAPEQLTGERAGPAADIYGLGILLYEMLTGKPPYEVASPFALMEAQRAEAVAVPGAPTALQELVRRCLATDPERRPASARAVADELATWLAGDVPTASIARPDQDDTVVIGGAVAGPVAASGDAPRRLSMATIAAVVGAVFVIGLIAALFTPRGSGGVPALAISPTPAAATSAPTPAPATPAPPAGPDTARIHTEVNEFAALVEEGRQQGLVHPGTAEDLRKEAEEISKKTDEGELDKVAEKLAELREKIDERVPDRIDPAFADRLREAVSEIESALTD